jgi:hypothetical protein
MDMHVAKPIELGKLHAALREMTEGSAAQVADHTGAAA